MTIYHVTADGVETLKTADRAKANAEVDRLLSKRPKPKDIRLWWPTPKGARK